MEFRVYQLCILHAGDYTVHFLDIYLSKPQAFEALKVLAKSYFDHNNCNSMKVDASSQRILMFDSVNRLNEFFLAERALKCSPLELLATAVEEEDDSTEEVE